MNCGVLSLFAILTFYVDYVNRIRYDVDELCSWMRIFLLVEKRRKPSVRDVWYLRPKFEHPANWAVTRPSVFKRDGLNFGMNYEARRLKQYTTDMYCTRHCDSITLRMQHYVMSPTQITRISDLIVSFKETKLYAKRNVRFCCRA